MPYPQITEYQEAVQHPAQAFIDPELKQGAVAENALGLPLVMSGGFALTYPVTTPRRKCAVRCFHREIPAIQQKYEAISKKLRSLTNGYFVDFDFQQAGISVRREVFPIVRMDWVEGGTLGLWLDKHFEDARALEKARQDFIDVARFLQHEGIAHGDIQNSNIMVENGHVKLIDYDGMYVAGMRQGQGSETGHKHFQHPGRRVADFGPRMDRFSFIALDLSLKAVIEDKSLYPKFREGGETIIFKANDFADPANSAIFRRLMAMPKLREDTRNFAAICEAALASVPTLDDYLVGRNIPAAKTKVHTTPAPEARAAPAAYIPAYPVIDALNFTAALQRVGDRVELVGRIVDVKAGSRKRQKGPAKKYVFISFGSGRGNVVQISIWSEGLAKLQEQPSKTWVGRWVSVTGLVEVFYDGKHYKRLSITVQEDGQIHRLDEAEAGFRLASVARVPRRTSAASSSAAAPPSVLLAKLKNLWSPSPQVKSRQQRARQQPAPASAQIAPRPAPAAQQRAASPSSGYQWIWAIAAIIALVMLLRIYG